MAAFLLIARESPDRIGALAFADLVWAKTDNSARTKLRKALKSLSPEISDWRFWTERLSDDLLTYLRTNADVCARIFLVTGRQLPEQINRIIDVTFVFPKMGEEDKCEAIRTDALRAKYPHISEWTIIVQELTLNQLLP